MSRNKVIVFGGRGFAGSSILREARARLTKLQILSASRSSLDGLAVDALKPETYQDVLSECHGVVVSVGLPPWTMDRQKALQVNGEANAKIIEAASAARVPHLVLVSATMPGWTPSGYRDGKIMAASAAEAFAKASPEASVTILKPSVISGTRQAGPIPIPLWIFFEPMRFVMCALQGVMSKLEAAAPSVLGGMLQPPVRVSELAAAAVDGLEAAPGVRVLSPADLIARGKKVV